MRRRDSAVCNAVVVRIGDETSLLMLLIESEPAVMTTPRRLSLCKSRVTWT